ncbi:hypothetical protein VOLCADRAFT_98865 [Volvox carteri f. nagariensis]|uniref:Uncharacterized protein n=1 Tax=Volvox carteri f. nagariensis TaxID=3068 RepID=D8UGH3_VOLCA|nr:uncharacterized protein VOLCADRAFT_98865 [Volvox carteri f. nagariensis]EFJ41200.1 hypothetical protein VOLCADRAFT_98865 [Volvox carteri f. nagariensis]|eukprot:XP_002957768.1 hypothetical protein VOLCADRAFT_98865 [Volvox carteri f. nagariensis]
MELGDAEMATTGSLAVERRSSAPGTSTSPYHVENRTPRVNISCGGAGGDEQVVTADISELIGELQVVELQAQLQQSSSALRSSQQQLQGLSARVEELEASLETEVERMVATLQADLQAAHDAHEAKLQEAESVEISLSERTLWMHLLSAFWGQGLWGLPINCTVYLNERLWTQEAAAAEVAATAAAREADLQEALRAAQQAAQQAEATIEVERNTCRQLQARLGAYEDLCWRLEMELRLPDACGGTAGRGPEGGALGPPRQPYNPSAPYMSWPESLLAAARALQARLRDQAARGAAAADAVAAAASAAAAAAAAWRGRAQRADADAAAATIATEELRHSLGTALAALHEEAALLAATNTALTADLEQRQTQVAELMASSSGLEAQVVQLGGELSSLDNLRTALERELFDAGERHSALEAQVLKLQNELAGALRGREELAAKVSELQKEVAQAHSRKDSLANEISELRQELQVVRVHKAGLEEQVSDLNDELHSTRTREQQQLSLLEAERETWKRERERMGEEGASLAAAASALMAAAECGDARSRTCTAATTAALEEALRAAAAHLENARRASDFELEKMRMQVVDLYERLGQAKSRILVEAERHEDARQAERAAEQAARAALQNEAAVAAAAALCARVFRSVERAAAASAAADVAMDLVAAERHAAQQVARVVCARVVRRQEAIEAQAAMAVAAAQLSHAEDRHANVLAEVAMARLADQSTAAARAQLIEAQLADSTRECMNLSAQAAELAGRLEQGETTAAGLAARLDKALAARAAAVEKADAAHERAAEAEAAVAQLQAELVAKAMAMEEAKAAAAQAADATNTRAAAAEEAIAHLQAELAAKTIAAEEARAAAVEDARAANTRAAVAEEAIAHLQAELAAKTIAAEEARAAAAQAADATNTRAAAAEEAIAHLQAELAAKTIAAEEARAAAVEDARAANTRAAVAEEAIAHLQAELAAKTIAAEEARAAAVEDARAANTRAAVAEEAIAHLQAELAAKTIAAEEARAAAVEDARAANARATAAEAAVAELQAEVAARAAVAEQANGLHTSVAMVDVAVAQLQAELVAVEREHKKVTETLTSLPYAQITAVGVLPDSPGPLSHRVDVDVGAEIETDGDASCTERTGPSGGDGSSDDAVAAATGAVSEAEGSDAGNSWNDAPGPATNTRELHLHQQVLALQDLLESEREANAARIVTLRAMRVAEREELHRQLRVLAHAAGMAAAGDGTGADAALLLPRRPAESYPVVISRQHSVTSVLEPQSRAGTLGPRASAPLIAAASAAGCGIVSVGLTPDASGHQVRRRASEPQRPRTGLPPLPPQAAQDISSTSSAGSSSYWLPAAAAVAAAANDYDSHHEPMWMANAAFGGTISLGCPSSAAVSETQVAELADTIATLRAELAASKEALRRERCETEVAGCTEMVLTGGGADTGCHAVGAVQVGVGNSPKEANADHRRACLVAPSTGPEMATSVSPASTATVVPVNVQQHSHDGGVSWSVSELLGMLEAERAARGVREVVLRVLRAVERNALQQELANMRAARAAAHAAATDARMRLSALLLAHARVCGEVEMLRASNDEMAAELGPARRAVEQLRKQNEQLWRDAREATMHCTADTNADTLARLASSEARESALAAQCEELAAKYEELEAQMHRGAVSVAASPTAFSTPPDAEAVAEVAQMQLAAQVTELPSELAVSPSTLKRLSTECMAARKDRQRLQQQLVSLLAHMAVVQQLADELCGSLHATTVDLNEQELDEQAPDGTHVQANSMKTRVGRRRQLAVETRAWARQASLLQEQLALVVQGARSGLQPLATVTWDFHFAESLPAATGLRPAAHPMAALSPELPAEIDRSPSTGAAGVAAAASLLRGNGWAGGSGGLALGRRCLSAIDLSSLAHRAEEAAAAAEFVAAAQLPAVQSQLQQEHQQQLSPGHDSVTGPPAGGCGSFLPGLHRLNLHHFALLQGRGYWNPWAMGAAVSTATVLQRLRARGSATVGGAASTAPVAVPVPAPLRSADGAAIGGDSTSNFAENNGFSLCNIAGTVEELIPQASAGPAAAFVACPSEELHGASGAHADEVAASREASPMNCIAMPSSGSVVLAEPELTISPVASPPGTRGFKPFWSSHPTGCVLSPHSARHRAGSAGQLRRLEEAAEEEGEGEGEERQEAWTDGELVLEEEEEEAEDQAEVDEERDLGAEGGWAFGGADCESPEVAPQGAARLALGRAASETDMQLFFNPMFAAGQEANGAGAGNGTAAMRRSLNVLPASARPSRGTDDVSFVTGLHAARVWGRMSANRTLPAAAGYAYPSRPLAQSSRGSGSGSIFARARRMSIDHRVNDLVRRQSLWPSPSMPEAAGASSPSTTLATPALSGPSLAGVGTAGGGEQLVPVSRSNPMVKLYKKISKRLSTTSRDSREGL